MVTGMASTLIMSIVMGMVNTPIMNMVRTNTVSTATTTYMSGEASGSASAKPQCK